jgi:hypothetical protein
LIFFWFSFDSLSLFLFLIFLCLFFFIHLLCFVFCPLFSFAPKYSYSSHPFSPLKSDKNSCIMCVSSYSKIDVQVSSEIQHCWGLRYSQILMLM